MLLLWRSEDQCKHEFIVVHEGDESSYRRDDPVGMMLIFTAGRPDDQIPSSLRRE